MRLIAGFVFHIFSNALALLTAIYLVDGFVFKGGLGELLLVATFLTLANTFLRPILKLIFGPFIVLTLGLFTLVVNALILYLLDIFTEPLIIEGYLPLLIATFIIAVVNFLINLSAKLLYRK